MLRGTFVGVIAAISVEIAYLKQQKFEVNEYLLINDS